MHMRGQCCSSVQVARHGWTFANSSIQTKLFPLQKDDCNDHNSSLSNELLNTLVDQRKEKIYSIGGVSICIGTWMTRNSKKATSMSKNNGYAPSHSAMHGRASLGLASDALSAWVDSVANHRQAYSNSLVFFGWSDKEWHSRYHRSLRDICSGRNSNTDVASGRIILLILSTVPAIALLRPARPNAPCRRSSRWTRRMSKDTL